MIKWELLYGMINIIIQKRLNDDSTLQVDLDSNEVKELDPDTCLSVHT